jgi:ribosomal protein S18 acetylase RimI-like enzyme
VEIRPAQPRDAEAVADALLAGRAGMTYLPRVHEDDDVRAWIRDVLLPTREVWVAAGDDDRALGFAALGDDELEQLYVHPDAQSRGLGSALLDRAKERRPQGLQLWVFQRNEGARRFYERHGFELVRETDGAGNEEREPDALYAWRPP